MPWVGSRRLCESDLLSIFEQEIPLLILISAGIEQSDDMKRFLWCVYVLPCR